MKDLRLQKLAKLMVNYSVETKKGDKATIILYGLEGLPLLREVYKELLIAGAHVKYIIQDDSVSKIFYDNAKDFQLKYFSELKLKEAEETDVLVQIIAENNKMELATIDQKKIIMRSKIAKPISDAIHKAKWILFEYPTASGAQDAKMSLEEWEDFVLESCLIDYKRINQEQDILHGIVKKAKEIQIIGKGTDLKVNVSGQKWKKCVGERNLPDGELFTSPVRNGVNGVITFNTPTVYMGKEFEWIKLTFKDGKVVEARSDRNEKDLNTILDTDPGARYLGEFSFGLNRNIKKPVRSILFDEKIGGSNHMALGKCYEEAPNGNDSVIHWDMIMRHKEAKGEVYIDGKLVQKDGLWLVPELKKFNR